MIKARYVAPGLLLAGVLALTGCADYNDGGVEGRVVDKDRRYIAKVWRYELDILDSNGVEHEIRVNSDTFYNCFNGSHYPTCKDR